MVTGKTEEDAAEAPSLFSQLDRPTVVFVFGAASADDDTMQKIEDIVFKSEKVGLGMKAFRRIKISPENAEKDALISERGKTVPRLLFIDPVKEKVKVLESKKIKSSTVYGAMKIISKRFYKENLDKVVKRHIKMLNEQDKLAGEMKTLNAKLARLEDDAKKNKKKLENIRAEKDEVQEELQALAEAQRKLWQLTSRHAKDAPA